MPILEPVAVMLKDFETDKEVRWTWEQFLAHTTEQLMGEAGGDKGDIYAGSTPDAEDTADEG